LKEVSKVVEGEETTLPNTIRTRKEAEEKDTIQ
jgi:hypothetical protein